MALEPLRTGAWAVEATRRALGAEGIGMISGMMAMKGEDYGSLESIRRTGGLSPDEAWDANLAAAQENAKISRDLGLALVTFHAGFLPHAAEDPHRLVMIDRLGQVTEVFSKQGIEVALETGQETAQTLLGMLEEVAQPGVGVNFDPANMILYGLGDPVESLRALLPKVRQVHVKDAVAASTPGQWGIETRVGTGDVPWSAFFAVLRQSTRRVDLVIERESGEQRVADVATAMQVIEACAEPLRA